MGHEEYLKKWQVKLNWRAHVSSYVGMQENLKRNNQEISPEQYCIEEGINQPAFRWWLNFIKQEDKFTFYRSFATAYLGEAKKSLELLEHYIDIDPELRMPLMRDAIISYSALFRKSNGRVFTKWHLEAQKLVPSSLFETHNKICTDRDLIFAHCDLGARDPKVSSIGIALRGNGFYWDDYRILMPQFKSLIETVLNNLENYTHENGMSSAEEAFKNFPDPPPEALIDPGNQSFSSS